LIEGEDRANQETNYSHVMVYELECQMIMGKFASGHRYFVTFAKTHRQIMSTRYYYNSVAHLPEHTT
jgi:hypothetical protein